MMRKWFEWRKSTYNDQHEPIASYKKRAEEDKNAQHMKKFYNLAITSIQECQKMQMDIHDEMKEPTVGFFSNK